MAKRRNPAERLAPLLLGACATLLGLWLATLALWWRAAPAQVDLRDLDEETRRELVGDLLTQSPGVFQWSWYAPEMGYTLRPDADLEAWGDSFRSNAQGFRTGPLAKSDDVFRVVFLGDSWTFGMGVTRDQSYPEVFARLANARDVAERQGRSRVEAWTLALPGWNLFNSTAAFWHHLHALRPDAVVIGVSANDNHSTHAVLPNGSSTKAAPQRDQYGDGHPVIYGARRVDSFRYAERWRLAFAAVRDLEDSLEGRQIPLSLLFVGRPRTLDMHARVAESDLKSPYSVVPLELTKGRWSTEGWGHGTPEAHDIYGAYVYATLAPQLGWPELDAAPRAYGRWQAPVSWQRIREVEEVRDDLRGLVETQDLQTAYRLRAKADSADLFAARFGPSRRARLQTLGALQPRTGILGPAATILLRRPAGAQTVVLTLEPIAEAAALYPLTLSGAIPHAEDPLGERTTTWSFDGAATTVELPIPPQVEHSILDLQLTASRAGARGALRIASVEVR